MAQVTVNIPELFRTVAAAVNARTTNATLYATPFTVYYDYGRYNEITNRLTEKGRSTGAPKAERYPLIWLVIPFTERYGRTEQYCELRELQIIIADVTRAQLTSPDRVNTVYPLRLEPLYQELLRAIKLSGYFSYDGYELPHDRVLQPYWDGGEGVTAGGKNMFNDMVDVIQVKNVQLNVNLTRCPGEVLLSRNKTVTL